MANLNITNNDLAGLLIEAQGNDFADDEYSGVSGNKAAGTIVARSSVTGHLITFVKGGSTNGNGTPVAVLPYTLAHTGGAATVRALIAGKVRKEKLIIAADGDDTNIDAAVKDKLRNVGIVPVVVSEQNTLDNQ